MNETSGFRPGGHAHGTVSIARLKRTIKLGVKSIWLHGLRSFLTVLGIVFGVCSVISMLAVGEGASHDVQEQIRQLGSNNIIIKSVKPPENSSQSSRGPQSIEYGLTYADLREVKAVLPSVRIVVPARLIPKRVWSLSRSVDCEIAGTVPWYPEMRNHAVARGRFISEAEMDGTSNVCVIGWEMSHELFPLNDPIGRSIKVEGNYYRIIGIMEPLAKESSDGSANTESRVGMLHRLFIPLTAAKDRFGETIMKRSSGSFEAERVELHEATIQVQNQDDVLETWHIVEEILDRRHKKEDFTITVPLDLMRSAEETKRIFNLVLGAIAGISLLVGGIGIMNIMLASVTERTREIGIRRALGAKRRDIVLQFLVETVILSGAGGLIGVALGISIPYFITYFSNMPTIVTLWSPILAFSISAFVGIIFGLYPAMRAADMDPVEALRHE